MIKKLFSPKSIAVVGASKEPSKLGHILLKNVIDYDFSGNIYPINPQGPREILEKKVFPSLKELSESPDLVLISIPNQYVPEIVKEAVKIRAKSLVILSSGFGESRGDGKELQEKILKAIKNSKIRIIGPNCMGIYNINDNLNGTYFWELPRKPGNISFISQSGAYGGMLFSEIKKRNIGISKFVSIGNQIDITHTEILEYLGNDENTKVIAMFIEEIKDIKNVMKIASKISKPIIAFKVGRTDIGKVAVLSHTGSMAGEYEIYKAAFKQSGIISANDTDEFFDTLSLFSAYPDTTIKRKSLGILTISGGPCVAASDTASEIGILVPELSKNTRKKIGELKRREAVFYGEPSI